MCSLSLLSSYFISRKNKPASFVRNSFCQAQLQKLSVYLVGLFWFYYFISNRPKNSDSMYLLSKKGGIEKKRKTTQISASEF